MSGESRKNSAVSFMPVAGLLLALAAGAAAALAGFGSRLDLWHFRTGFIRNKIGTLPQLKGKWGVSPIYSMC